MRYGTCVEKLRNKYNKAYGYKLLLEDGTIQEFKTKELKELMLLGEIDADNLRLTNSGRLVHIEHRKKENKNMQELLDEGKLLERIADSIIIANSDIFPLGIKHIKMKSKNKLGNHFVLTSKILDTNKNNLARVIIIVSKQGIVFGAVDNKGKIKHIQNIGIDESIQNIELTILNNRKSLGIKYKPMVLRDFKG